MCKACAVNRLDTPVLIFWGLFILVIALPHLLSFIDVTPWALAFACLVLSLILLVANAIREAYGAYIVHSL